MYNKSVKIFSGTAHPELATHVASKLNLSVSPIEIHVFPDGEKRIKINDTVVDEDCIVVQPTAPPVDTNYMELFFLVDSLKRSGARSITAVIPYLGYQRQDHVFRDGEAVSLAVVIKMLETAGVTKVIAFDLHSIKIPEFFTIPLVHLSALGLFADKIEEHGWNTFESVLVTPDMGGIRRIKMLSALLNGLPTAAIEKNRDLVSGAVSADIVHGALAKRAIIVDDMISSGKTIATAANLLKQKGVEDIVVFATHPVFSEEAPGILESSLAEKVYVTDSIFVPKQKHFAKLAILSIAGMIAKEIS
jgi:ribose-phosphate pyrophosphokinase